MKLLEFLFRNGACKILVIVALGLISGFSSAGFVMVINAALQRTDRQSLLGIFILIVTVRLAASMTAGLLLVRFSQESVLRLSNDLCRRILATPFRRLEQIGPSSVLATLIDDVNLLANAINSVPNLTGHLAVLLGCSLYLLWTSPTAFLFVLALAIVGYLCYMMIQKKAFQAINRHFAARNTLFHHFRSLTEGIKELKMNRDRRSALLKNEIAGTMDYLRRQNFIAAMEYLKAEGFSQVMFYLMMGLLLFLLPALQEITAEELARYVFVGLYLITPIWGLIVILPAFSRGKAAMNRIESLQLALETGGLNDSSKDVVLQPLQPPRAVPVVQLDQVCFSYGGNGTGRGFSLGPIDLTIQPGELIFIVGGNGSGKSTLVKLMTGLYTPDSGEIRVNGRTVGRDDDEYRQLFSTVFSDFFLFDRLLGIASNDLDRRANNYLDRLNLTKIVDIKDGVFSSTALSQGQRRRLALLTAYLEDRPIYVFDEWAADQDPAYKQVFYTLLLPELKATGKTVVVITHDDRYFHSGDYIVKIDDGRIVEQHKAAGR